MRRRETSARMSVCTPQKCGAVGHSDETSTIRTIYADFSRPTPTGRPTAESGARVVGGCPASIAVGNRVQGPRGSARPPCTWERLETQLTSRRMGATARNAPIREQLDKKASGHGANAPETAGIPRHERIGQRGETRLERIVTGTVERDGDLCPLVVRSHRPLARRAPARRRFRRPWRQAIGSCACLTCWRVSACRGLPSGAWSGVGSFLLRVA